MKELSKQSKQLREVIRAAYRQGEEAVIGLVENLLKAQAEAIEKRESRIKVLEDQLVRIVRTGVKHRLEMGLRNEPKVCGLKVDVKAEDKRDILAAPWNGWRSQTPLSSTGLRTVRDVEPVWSKCRLWNGSAAKCMT